ncbi:MAG: HD domain-containing protein [Planctomycetes bacterium]|nr:HD domain-containing protein [Planctomycetota bacterium]
MQKSDLKRYTDWFYEYIGGFFGDDGYINANLELKKEHTGFVVEAARYIACGVGLDENDVLAAETAGLLHDVGRFEQFVKYQTYSDCNSINHSDLAVDIILAEGVLDGLDEGEREIILSAVKLHGIKDLPGELSEKTLLHCRIVRDADKLDIYRVLQEKYLEYINDPENYNLELEHPDEPWYSEIIIQSIFNGEQIHYSEVKTLNDFKLLILAMVFDVNFQPTFKIIKEKQYIQAFIDMLPADDTIYKVRDRLVDYIDSRLRSTGNL